MFARSPAKAFTILLFVVMAAFLTGSAGTQLGQDAVFLRLRADGAVIEGESPFTSLGREGMIVVASYTQSGSTPTDATSGQAGGVRHYDPVRIRKPVDKSSPLIAKAWVQRQAIDAELLFFRPNPTGDGTTQIFNKVTFGGAIISSVRTAYSETGELLEEVTIVFRTIQWDNPPSGISFQDSIL